MTLLLLLLLGQGLGLAKMTPKMMCTLVEWRISL
jgi:hypothetical protein